MKNIYSKGFTLIEIIVVIAIVVLLVAVVALPFGKFRSGQALENTTNTIVTVLQEARAKSLAGASDTTHSVRFESAQAILFQGITYSAGASTNQIFSYDAPVTLGTLALNGGGSQVTFDRLRGTTTTHGTITVQLPGSGGAHTITITITATGSVARE